MNLFTLLIPLLSMLGAMVTLVVVIRLAQEGAANHALSHGRRSLFAGLVSGVV